MSINKIKKNEGTILLHFINRRSWPYKKIAISSNIHFMKTTFLIMGNQLFPFEQIQQVHCLDVYMAEDHELCNRFKYHKHKLMHFLISMRHYAQQLRQRGFNVTYSELNSSRESYIDRLEQYLVKNSFQRLIVFEIEDKFFEERVITLCNFKNIELVVLRSPNFVVSRDQFTDYIKSVKRPFLKTFYQQQRENFSILLDTKGGPLGGQWSFDEANRKKLPKGHHPPLSPPPIKKNLHQDDVAKVVDHFFGDHPGETRHFWLPTTHQEADEWLKHFLKERLEHFGDYQDALSVKHDFLYHSLIAPSLNIGHLLPSDVIEKAIAHHEKHQTPLNSLEGFIRQILGWREFVRGIYQEYDEFQQQENFFNHQRQLTKSWYTGDTQIPPLDFAIHKLNRWGYAHHIERLMVISNLMLLCEIHPQNVYSWFMEMFVDSSDWVMGPNVFGMGQFSDGGLFATKPYICGSNYLCKMSDFPKGDWCDLVDGLYWRFIDRHQDFFAKQYRLSMMVRTWQKMDPQRKVFLLNKAESFLHQHTVMAKFDS